MICPSLHLWREAEGAFLLNEQCIVSAGQHCPSAAPGSYACPEYFGKRELHIIWQGAGPRNLANNLNRKLVCLIPVARKGLTAEIKSNPLYKSIGQLRHQYQHQQHTWDIFLSVLCALNHFCNWYRLCVGCPCFCRSAPKRGSSSCLRLLQHQQGRGWGCSTEGNIGRKSEPQHIQEKA